MQRLLMLLLLVLLLPVRVHAQESRSWIVMIDAVPDSVNGVPRAKQLLSMPVNTAGGRELMGLITAATEPRTVLHSIRTRAGTLTGANRERWHSKPGDTLLIYTFARAGRGWSIGLKEEARKSRLAEDALLLARVAVQIAVRANPAATPDPDGVELLRHVHVLQKERANVTVWAAGRSTRADTDSDGVTHVVRCRSDVPVTACTNGVELVQTKPAARDSIVARIVTGPAERGFITANAAVNNPRGFALPGDTATLQLAEDPSDFMIGFNYTFGDLSAGEEDTGTFNGLYLGASVHASRRPFSQVGVAAGLRHNPIPVLDRIFPFETISPYVGLRWGRYEVATADGRDAGTRWTKPERVFGVAMNLGRALEWLTGGDEEK